MLFNRDTFRQCLLGRKPPIDYFLKESIRASYDEESKIGNDWLDAMFSQLEILMKDPAQSPYLKIGAVKFAVYLLLLGDVEICKKFERKVYPYVRNLSQYDRHARMERKGEELFKNHTIYVNGTPQVKEQVRKLGIDYVRICLESVPVWATWLPDDITETGKQSLYVRGYQALLKDGMQFPPEEEYQFYTKTNVERMEQKAKQITEEVLQETSTSFVTDNQSYSEMRRLRQSVLRTHTQKGYEENRLSNQKSLQLSSNMKGPKKMEVLKEGQNGFLAFSNNLAKTFKTSSAVSDRQNEREKELMGEVERLKRDLQQKSRQVPNQADTVHMQNKIKRLEQRETELMKTVDETKAALQQAQQYNQQSLSKTGSIGPSNRQLLELRSQLQSAKAENASLVAQIRRLQSAVNAANEENGRLRSEISVLQRAGHQSSGVSGPKAKQSAVAGNGGGSQLQELRQHIRRLQEENRQLKVNLLSECIESSEFTQDDLKRRKDSRIRFEDYSNDELFEPYYSNLSTEEQIRFRKSIIKSKELLFRESSIEIGCVTQLLTANKLKVSLFLTNVSREVMTNVECVLTCGRGLTVVEGSERPLSTIAPSYQEKMKYVIQVNSEDFGCAVVTIKYQQSAGFESKQLLLPISKVKLSEPKAFLPDSELNESRQQTVELDARLMQSISRIQQHFRLIYERKQGNLTHYYLQFTYLKDKYELSWSQTDKLVRIIIRCGTDCLDLANKLLAEWAFILSKESS